MKTRFLRFLACALCLLPLGATQALALSELELKSFLNQPLEVRIRFAAASQAELDSLTVSVRGTSVDSRFDAALRHELGQDERGPYLRITSRDAIREPILNLVLDLSWSGGRLGREYALIIDPR